MMGFVGGMPVAPNSRATSERTLASAAASPLAAHLYQCKTWHQWPIRDTWNPE